MTVKQSSEIHGIQALGAKGVSVCDWTKEAEVVGINKTLTSIGSTEHMNSRDSIECYLSDIV